VTEVKAVLYTMLFHIIHNIGSTSNSGSHLRKLLHFWNFMLWEES